MLYFALEFVGVGYYLYEKAVISRNYSRIVMKFYTKYHKKQRTIELAAAGVFICLAILLFPSFEPFTKMENNRFTVYLYGEELGVLSDEEAAQKLLLAAKKEQAMKSSGLYMVDNPSMKVVASSAIWGKADLENEVYRKMLDALDAHRKETLKRAYMVKVNTQIVSLSDAKEVEELFYRAIQTYDENGKFSVEFNQDPNRILKTLTAEVEVASNEMDDFQPTAGIESVMEDTLLESNEIGIHEFDEYELGLSEIGFSEGIEITEAYIPQSEIVDVETALNMLTCEQEVQQLYEVQSGDTLSEISLKVNIPMEQIVEMNSDYMENINSTIHVGQSLIITVPTPELSILWTSREHYEEIYEAEVVYIDNDEWYTTQKVTLQEPSAGYREVIADIHYSNEEEIGRDIIKENVIMEAVPKIVERGTKIPPTYIKPISGGRLTSGFGKRKAPKPGASTYHKGIDWATPVGTPVYASSGGTVAKAGWGSGYGYVIYINHPDGKQTRYGHLSKIYVKAGQSVSQNDKIALTGNTGISTGPHIHFEILVNGKQVNPFDYLN